MSKQSYNICFCFRRQYRVASAEAPASVKAIFDEYSVNGVMDVDHLWRFLVEVQREEGATREDAQAVIDSLKHLSLIHKRGINILGFFKYLFGDINPPLNPKLGVHHDMTAPLSHYFIYTSHNSYLTGNQLCSDSSDAPIITALHNGVRVVELDIWPNSRKNDINVLHGRTLTTPVKLIKCLRSIKEHAFAASEYPVVVTLEDHLTTPDLQAKAAEMITQTFGDMLFTPFPKVLSEFPSPESLKRRVIISTKPPKEYLTAKDVKGKDSGPKNKNDLPKDEPWGNEVKSFKHKYWTKDDDDLEGESDDDDLDVDGEEEEEDDDQASKSRRNSAPEYRRLIAIHAGKGKGGMKDWLRVDPEKVRRLSLSEQKLEKAVITYGKDIVRFTQKNLLRVYPKGTRFDSSNYNPLIGWMHGAQMVAFNMQSYEKPLWLMHGMFKANDACGYVKKPDFLLKAGDEIFDPTATLPKTTLKVRIYMGEGWYSDFTHTYFDSCSPPDLYARVGIAGVPADVTMMKTKTIQDNWIPIWDEVFEFPLTVPELALLRIEVREYDMSEKDDFAGQTCLPISELRQGIRSVPLHSKKGVQYKSVKLLMRFEFSDTEDHKHL